MIDFAEGKDVDDQSSESRFRPRMKPATHPNTSAESQPAALNGSVLDQGPEADHASDFALSSGSRRVSMTLINFWLDTALMIVFVTLGIVAVIVQFVFPPGIAARGWLLWGMTYSRWCSLQFSLICVLALGILVHVMLHWTWICGVVFRRLARQNSLPDDGIRTVIGVGLLIGILLVSSACVGVAMMTIHQP
jgi:hypothetical protein